MATRTRSRLIDVSGAADCDWRLPGRARMDVMRQSHDLMLATTNDRVRLARWRI
jgi:hypothetical protein